MVFCIAGLVPWAQVPVLGKVSSRGLWVVTPCNDVVGYQRFGGPCCLHLQCETANVATSLVNYKTLQ